MHIVLLRVVYAQQACGAAWTARPRLALKQTIQKERPGHGAQSGILNWK